MGPVPKPCRSRWTDALGRRSECAPRAQGQACRRSPWADRFFWTPVVAERVEHPVRQCVKPSLGSCAAALRRTRRNPVCRLALHGRKGVSGQPAPGAPGRRRRRPRPPAVRFRACRSTGPETRRNGRLRTVLRGAVQRSGPREGLSREPFSANSPWPQNWATTEAAGRAGMEDGGQAQERIFVRPEFVGLPPHGLSRRSGPARCDIIMQATRHARQAGPKAPSERESPSA